MLLSSYGALRLGKVLSISSRSTVTQFEGISNLATMSARPGMAWFGNGQSLYVLFCNRWSNLLNCTFIALLLLVLSRLQIYKVYGARAMELSSELV